MAPGVAIAPEKLSSFEPSLWGDFFITYEPQPLQRSQEWMKDRTDTLKENVNMLFKTCSNTTARMFLVNELQHLGIDHHFQEQIDTVLSEILKSDFSTWDLHEIAVRFQLLREHGLWVSPDVFNKFKGEDGKFIKDIINEPRGMLSLYNAAHLFIHGEPALEEAITFARHHLETTKECVKSPLSEQIKRSLHLPRTRSFKRMETLYYMSEYIEEEAYNPILLELAKLDFNLLQHDYLKELKTITEWWKQFLGYVKLGYVRDRVVECYLWAYVVYYEKGFEVARSILAKINVLLTMMDDTYDMHATIEDCRNLTETIQRCDDQNSISLLPEYLKNFYSELLRNIQEMEGKMACNVNHESLYLKKQFQAQFTWYLQEAEWSHQNHKPSFEDHVSFTALTIGVPTVCVGLMAGMDDAIMRGALEWISGLPDIVIATGKIARLMNDVAAFKRGKCKGDVANSVECYMSEHRVTREEAFARIDILIENEWKTLNQARFEHQELLPAVQRVINLCHSVPLMYSEKVDAFTFSKHLQKTIESLFVKPVSM